MTQQKIFSVVTFVAVVAFLSLPTLQQHAQAQFPVPAASVASPDSYFRPIGAPSAVDKFTHAPHNSNSIRPQGVVQAAFMQSDFQMPSLDAPPTSRANEPPPSSFNTPALQPLQQQPTPPSLQTPPPGSTQSPPINPAPLSPPVSRGANPVPNQPNQPNPVPGQTNQPNQLNPVPGQNGLRTNTPLSAVPLGSGASPSDMTPIPSPQLSTPWATVDNCSLVSPASGYRAQFWGCGPTVPAGQVPYAAPQTIAPPTVMPGAPGTANLYGGSVGPKPLFTLGQERNNVSLGQGIIGQPKAYVPGQYVRNFIRYLTP